MVRVKAVAGVVKKLERNLANQQIRKGERIATEVGEELKKLLSQTLENSDQSDIRQGSGFRDAEVHVKTKVQKKPYAVASVRVVVLDDRGNPHLPWHIIQFGRRDGVMQGRTSPIIKRTRGNRTQIKTLKVGAFRGYSGSVFVIRAGQRIRGIPAREWYQAAYEQLKLNPPGWKVTPTLVDPKYGKTNM